MMKPNILDVKYNGLDIYETMRQVDRDIMLYNIVSNSEQNSNYPSIKYKSETNEERFLRYYNNIDIYIETDCSDEEWEQIKNNKVNKKLKKEYAKLVAEEFDLELRGYKSISETQICIIILSIIFNIILYVIESKYLYLGIASTMFIYIVFYLYIKNHNNNVVLRLSQIVKQKKKLIKQMKGSK